MTAPDLTSAWEEERASRLGVARRRATGLLLLVALGLVATHVFTDGTGVWGFVQAFAEAAVVGGVADWFAVTALFRHPLGVPIPHTAIIPKGKDVFGRSLGEFFAQNFLDGELVAARLEEIDPAMRVGTWLSGPENAERAGAQIAALISGAADALRDREVQDGIREAVETRIREVDVAPLVGSAVDYALAGDHYEALVDAALGGLSRTVAANQHVIRDRIRRESPWWVPEPLDDKVYEKVYEAIQRLLAELSANPEHELRRHFKAQARDLAERLRTSPELRERGEILKAEVLAHPDFQKWTETLWSSIKDQLAAAAEDPDSGLRRRLVDAAQSIGVRLTTEDALRHRVNTWIVSFARQIADQSGPEVTKMITSTVDRWDPTETSNRLELLLGRDLQFIRINGTLVGGLIGVLIHTAFLLF